MTNKIDHRINYRIVLDTEACPLDRDLEGVSPYNMLVYDVGWAVTDKHGNIYRTRSFVNRDIFCGEYRLMQSAYYADKIPQYIEDLASGARILADLAEIHKVFLADLEEYDVEEVYAHNMRFDDGSLNNTERYVTKSQHRYFFPYDTILCDTMKMVNSVVAKTPTYIKFCKEHNFLTKTGRPQVKAEVVYAYITKNPHFVEKHTGIEDVLIETAIMAYCFSKHKAMDRVYRNHNAD